MKKILNKTTMAIILALSIVLALLGGIFFAKQVNVANAADKAVTVKIEALDDNGDTVTSFSSGMTFNVKVTVRSSLEGKNFAAVSLHVGPTNAAKDGFDATKCGFLEFVPYSSSKDINKSTNLANTRNFDDSSGVIKSNFADDGLVRISIADKGTKPIPCGGGDKNDLVFEFKLKIKEGVTNGTDFDIGIMENKIDKYAYVEGVAQKEIFAEDKDNFEIQTIKFAVKEPSNVSTLATLKVGQGDEADDLTNIDLSEDNLTVTVTDLIDPLSVLPNPTDENAKVTVKPTNDSSATAISISNNTIGKIAIPDDGEITVIVTAENGVDKTEYKLKVTVIGAKLVALTATPDSTESGVTKKGLKEAFDSATLAYTVYVPNDQANKVTVNAEVSTGHSESTTMDIATKGTCSAASTATSKTAFDVTGIEDGDTLTITCNASQGSINSKKEYTLTFDVVDTDATLDTIKVVGKTTSITFENNESMASAEKVDFYFVVSGETNAASNVTLAATSSVASIKLDTNAYTAAKELNAGSHTVTIEAEAGNTKVYVFYLKNYIPLLLKANASADYMFEERDYDALRVYRRTYKEKGLTHGIDDLGFERYVIGQIKDLTTIKSFLDNFDASIHNSLKIYDSEGTLVYDRGTAASGYNASDLDSTNKAVGTRWKIEYYVNGNLEDTVYLSVLGDLNGDGRINALDIGEIAGVIQGFESTMEIFNANVEYRLAAYLDNSISIQSGQIKVGSPEIPYIARHMNGSSLVSDEFYKG